MYFYVLFSPYTGVVLTMEAKTGPGDIFICEQQPTYSQYVHGESVFSYFRHGFLYISCFKAGTEPGISKILKAY